MDAHSFGTNVTLWQVNALTRNITAVSEIFKYIYNDPITFYGHWIFCVYSIMRLSGFERVSIEDAKKMSHPPSAIRISMILSNIATLIELSPILPEKEILEACFHATQNAESAFLEVTFEDDKFISLTDTMSDESRTWKSRSTGTIFIL